MGNPVAALGGAYMLNESGAFDPRKMGGTFAEIPSTEEQDFAREFLMNLLGPMNFPEMEFEGMTDTEKEAQGVLAGLLRGEAFEDPMESEYWKGMRDRSELEEERTVSALRHRQSGTGMYKSGRALAHEGEVRRGYSADRTALLGSLYERERNRDNPYTRLAAVQAFGGLERDLAEKKYGREMFKTLAPYQYQFPVASKILDEIRYMYDSPQYGPSVFSEVSGMAQGLGSAAASVVPFML